MATFIIELPIQVAPEQIKGLNKRFDCARHVYNNTLADINKLYNQMCNAKEYKALVDELGLDECKVKILYNPCPQVDNRDSKERDSKEISK